MTGSKSLKIIFVLAIIILLLLIPYWIFDEESKTLDDNIRRGLPGQFIKLSDGYVHYELSGPDDGPVAVLIHGISTPYFVWDDTRPALAKAAIRDVDFRALDAAGHIPHYESPERVNSLMVDFMKR